MIKQIVILPMWFLQHKYLFVLMN